MCVNALKSLQKKMRSASMARVLAQTAGIEGLLPSVATVDRLPKHNDRISATYRVGTHVIGAMLAQIHRKSGIGAGGGNRTRVISLEG